MHDVMFWLSVGLMAGGVASLLVPSRPSGGALQAITLGILGGVFGGSARDTLDVGPILTGLGALAVAIVAAFALLSTMRSIDRTGRN